MKTIYAKCLLRACAKLQAIVDKIDDLVLKKALASFMDTSPASAQYDKILEHTFQKDILIYINGIVENIYESFPLQDRIYIDYKYFKKMDKKAYENLDFSSRAYFRHQLALIKKFAVELEKKGVDDEFFERELKKISAVRSIYDQVQREESNYNKKTNKKTLPVKVKKSA